MLLPYNVDRPARKFPWVTYALIGVNVFVFLLTVLIANVNLPTDKLLAKAAQLQLIQTYIAPNSEQSKIINTIRTVYPQILPAPNINAPTNDNVTESITDQQLQAQVKAQLTEKSATRLVWGITLQLAADHADQPGGYDRLWQIQHMNDRVVWEPHYSITDWLAYHPNEPSPWLKLLGMFGSMFLHGGFMHILGNMFFLWLFGRAVEDALGRPIYLGAYLLCGVAAVLMQHIMTMIFVPAQLGVPLLGASGAIAGVLGLFAPRFYRTPVRSFYVLPYAIPILVIAVGILATPLYRLSDDFAMSVLSGIIIAGAAMYFWGRTWCWGTFKAPAAWWLAFYILLFNIVPGVMGLVEKDGGGGVAHWAHIGGFGVGILYAFLINSIREGKTEFGLEDVEKQYAAGDYADAIELAHHLIQNAGEKAPALEVIAKSLAAQKKSEAAQSTFVQTIALYLKQKERDAAVRTYLIATSYFPTFTLPVSQQMTIGSTMESNGTYTHAVTTLEKIPVSYPTSPEAEIALLRCARIYILHLDNAKRAKTLLEEFMQRYPHSNWNEQAQQLLARIPYGV